MTTPDHQLKPIGQWTLEYLTELPAIELDWLDYKASTWLTLDEKNLQELSKYLSAFANFDGGYLIIGVTNPAAGSPPELDDGVDFSLKRDLQGWLEDKLPHLTEPKLPKIQIQPIPLFPKATRGPLVVYIPSSTEAPHQGHDHKFYTRIGTKIRALSTRAVFDIANRQKHPDVSATVRLNLFHYDDHDDPRSNLLWEVTNNSDILCLHVGLRIKVPLTYHDQPVLFTKKKELNSPCSARITAVRLFSQGPPFMEKSSSRHSVGSWRTKIGLPNQSIQDLEKYRGPCLGR